MSNDKQSSIEWLIDQLEKWELYSKISFQCLKEIEQAKAMHKEEMIKFAKDYWTESDTIEYTNAEIFYEQTFGGNK